MAKQIINIGTTANDKTGDPLRTAFGKVNANFTELYGLVVGGAAATVGTTPPTSPTTGALWWNTTDGKLYVDYNNAWVDTSLPASVVSVDRLTAGTSELILDSNGSLTVPSLFPRSFTASLDSNHNIPQPGIILTDTPWSFTIYFDIVDGQISTRCDQIFPNLVNPGYSNGDTFRFTEADHGIPGYTLEISIDNLVLPGGAGWTANLLFTQAPAPRPTIIAENSITFEVGGQHTWTFDKNGNLTLPGSVGFTGSTLYRLNGLTIDNSDLTHGATASITIPNNGSEHIRLQSLYGGVEIGTGPNNAVVNTWSFVDNGSMLFPQNVGFNLIWNSDTADGGMGGHLDQVKVYNTHLQGLTIKNTVSGVAHEWVFDKDKKLKLPEGGDIVDSTGTSVLGGSGNPFDQSLNQTDDVTFATVSFPTSGLGVPTVSTRSAGTKLVIWPEVDVTGHADYAIGMADSVLWQTVPTNGQSFKWYGGNQLALTVKGDGSLIPTNSIYAKSGDGTIGLIFSPDGTNNYGNITVNSAHDMTTQVTGNYSVALSGNERLRLTLQDTTLTGGNDLYIKSNKNTSEFIWKFDTAGKFITPGEIWTKAGDGIQGLTFSPDGTNSSAYIKVDGGQNCMFQANGNIYLRSAGTDRISITDTITTVAGASGVTIKVPNPLNPLAPKNWAFDGRGAILFPDGTTQTTGYSVVTIPSHSYGQANDKQGMIAFDANHFYYCTLDYDAGFPARDIWVRVAWSGTSW